MLATVTTPSRRSPLVVRLLSPNPLVVALVVGAVAYACDRSPTAVSTAPSSAPLAIASGYTKPSGLVVCSQSYDSVTQVIGPKGGYLAVGSHYLFVDSLVLTKPVTITAVAPAGTVRWVRFQPDGLLFPTNRVDGWGAILYTNYQDCGLTTTASPRLAQISDGLGIVTYLQTYVKNTQYIAALLPHFSNYAVAW